MSDPIGNYQVYNLDTDLIGEFSIYEDSEITVLGENLGPIVLDPLKYKTPADFKVPFVAWQEKVNTTQAGALCVAMPAWAVQPGLIITGMERGVILSTKTHGKTLMYWILSVTVGSNFPKAWVKTRRSFRESLYTPGNAVFL